MASKVCIPAYRYRMGIHKMMCCSLFLTSNLRNCSYTNHHCHTSSDSHLNIVRAGKCLSQSRRGMWGRLEIDTFGNNYSSKNHTNIVSRELPRILPLRIDNRVCMHHR